MLRRRRVRTGSRTPRLRASCSRRLLSRCGPIVVDNFDYWQPTAGLPHSLNERGPVLNGCFASFRDIDPGHLDHFAELDIEPLALAVKLRVLDRDAVVPKVSVLPGRAKRVPVLLERHLRSFVLVPGRLRGKSLKLFVARGELSHLFESFRIRGR